VFPTWRLFSEAPGDDLKPQNPFKPRPVEADYHCLLASFVDDHGDGRRHRPHALQFGQSALVFDYVPHGELDAVLTKELLRPVAEQSAGLLHEHYDIYYFAHHCHTPLARSPSANPAEYVPPY
jgi:hypothetical protein